MITRFILAVHCHQPVGNFPWVLEEAYRASYLPFLETLQRHPKIRVSMHYSGALLDWLEAEHPDFLRLLKILVRRGQVEILGGGYYEPILSMIPEEDALGQLKLMNETLRRLGLISTKAPVGGWLAERVWEPELPSLFARAGLRATLVDDAHLELAGVKKEDRFGYYMTEDRGACLSLFPSSKLLRYLVPFKPVSEVIEALKSLRSERPQAVVLADDGEKFGLWPGTHRWVYEEKWLETFFEELEHQTQWLRLMTLEEALKALPPLGKVYVPCASYEEMMGWSGGFFRNFLARYPEADTMHKRMLWVSGRLKGTQAAGNPAGRRLLEGARRHLYMAQSNDAYWHGIFGGLYLRHLRRAVWQHLLQAERSLEGSQAKRPWMAGEAIDLDADGKKEFLLRSPELTLLVDANRGGQLLELSDKVLSLNLLDTLTRRPERYHAKLRSLEGAMVAASPAAQASLPLGSPRGGEAPLSIHERGEMPFPDLGDSLVYDPYRRAGWVDHAFLPDTEVQEFASGGLREVSDFVEGEYQGTLTTSRDALQVSLSRRGRITLEGKEHPIHLKKRIGILRKGRRVYTAYHVTNASSQPIRFLFAVESSLNLKDAHVNRIGEAEGLRRFSLLDPAFHLKVSFSFSRPCRLWHFPLETVSDSERGMERTYQGVCLTFLWPIELGSAKSWSVRGTLAIGAPDENSA